MHFTAMDLVGKFKSLLQGYQYVLTVMDILTNYTWCIPLHTKEADVDLCTYVVKVYLTFGGSLKTLSDNGTEFKTHCSHMLPPS